MAKGEKQQALNQFGVEGAYAKDFNKRMGSDRSSFFPFLTNELEHPEGFGSDTVAQMLTQGGQAVSGATGAANEAATLNASRTGNSAAIPGIIDATARNAMKQQSDNALNVNIKNAMLKQQQQQEAAKGLEGLYSEDQNAVLHSLGLQNESLNAGTNASRAANEGALGWFNAIMGSAQNGASMGLKAAGAM